MSERTRLWERRPNESAKAYEAASLYFSLGAGRSLKEVSQRCTKGVSLLKRWSARHQWARRARLYDAHLAAIEQKSRERLAEEVARVWMRREQEIREREYTLADQILTKVEHMLNFPLAKQRVEDESGRRVTIVQPIRWTMFSVAHLATTGFELAHQAILNEHASHREVNEVEHWVLKELKPPAPKS